MKAESTQYYDQDKSVLRFANASMVSQKNLLTITEVCDMIKWKYPITEDDLQELKNVCFIYGIKTNVDNEKFFTF